MCGVSVPLDGRRGNMRSEGTGVVGGNVVAVGRGGRGWPPAPPRRAAQNGERFQVCVWEGFVGPRSALDGSCTHRKLVPAMMNFTSLNQLTCRD